MILDLERNDQKQADRERLIQKGLVIAGKQITLRSEFAPEQGQLAGFSFQEYNDEWLYALVFEYVPEHAFREYVFQAGNSIGNVTDKARLIIGTLILKSGQHRRYFRFSCIYSVSTVDSFPRKAM